MKPIASQMSLPAVIPAVHITPCPAVVMVRHARWRERGFIQWHNVVVFPEWWSLVSLYFRHEEISREPATCWPWGRIAWVACCDVGRSSIILMCAM
jgi:hypothetical protein